MTEPLKPWIECPASIAQHVAYDASSDHILAYPIERGAIIIGDRDDVTFRPAHTGYLFVEHNQFVIADQRGVSLLSFTVHFPRLAFQQMGCKRDAPAGNVRCDSLRFLFRTQNEIGKPSTGYTWGDCRVGCLRWRM